MEYEIDQLISKTQALGWEHCWDHVHKNIALLKYSDDLILQEN